MIPGGRPIAAHSGSMAGILKGRGVRVRAGRVAGVITGAGVVSGVGMVSGAGVITGVGTLTWAGIGVITGSDAAAAGCCTSEPWAAAG